MADNNDFNPKDALGPEFGKINPQNINPQSLQPFEGDRAQYPEVPEFFSIEPKLSNLDRPDNDIRRRQQGLPMSVAQMKNAMNSELGAVAATPVKAHAHIYSYNAGPNSNTFYNRYKAYGLEKFEKIGFSPIRDNEALFNARTSTWDDFSRMATNSLWPLFSKGFVAGPESLFNALSGDFGVDLAQARAYSEAAAIGQSSKDGFGAFMSNTTMSFAYTAGIITEAIVEEVAGALLAPVTGGASFFAATANNMRKAGKIFSAAEATYDGVRAINQTVKGLDGAADARKFWQTSVGKFINPLENVTDAWSDIRKGQAAGDNITNLAKVYKTAGGFYRDIRNANMALAEARLEGGFVQEDLYQELYDEYYAEHGNAPDNDTQKEMMKQAKAAGTEAVLWNTMLIYGTNKILLPNLLGPRGGIRKALTSKTDDILDLKTGKVIFDKAKKGGKKGPKSAEFKWREKSFKGGLKSFGKQPLGKTALGVMGYFKANVSEGLQENAQEVISEVSKGYYKQMFEDPAVVNREFTKGLLSHAIDSQLSAQGFETFASGFMMGMFAKPLNAALPAFNVGYNKMFDKEGYQAYREAKANTGENVAAALNELYSNPKEFFDSKLFNYAVQDVADDVIKGSPTKENRDAKDEALISQIITAMDTNTMDYFKDHLSSMKDLTPEEFEEAFGFEKGTGAEYQSRIDSIIARAESIESSYKNVKKKFPNPVNLNDYEVGTEEYNKAALLSSAWNMGYRNTVFFGESFAETTGRMQDIMTSFASDLDFSKVSSTDLQVLFDLPRMYNEADMLKTQIQGLEQSETLDRVGKKLLKDSKVKLEAYENFMNSLNTFRSYFFVESLTADQRKQHKDALASDLEREPTEQELTEALEDKYNTFRNEENDIKATNDFEQAFKKYLTSISNLADDHIFNKNVDDAFDKLIDFYRLEHEARSMAYYANLLANPADFRDHVERNYEWMSELYNNRKEHYDALVTNAMDKIEDNALINKLADDNIYVSPEDLARFKDPEDGRLPEEFFDASRKKVIPQGTPDYEKYANIFKMKAFMDHVAQERAHPMNKALEKKLAELQKEMDAKIDALPKVETQEDLGSIKKPKLKKLTIKHIVKNLNDKEYVTVTYNKGDVQETAVYYMDGEALKHTNAEGKEVNIDAITTTFVSAQKYKIVSKPDPVAEQEIVEEYKQKTVELIENFRKTAENYQEYVPITISTPVDQIPSKLKDELVTALNAEIAQTPGLYEGTEEEKLAAFMETPTASDIIGKYNEEQEALHALGQQDIPQAPIIAIDGKELDSSTMSAEKLRYYIKRYQDEIKVLDGKKKLTDEERKKHAEYKIVHADLVDYADWKLKIDRPEAMQTAISKIEQLKVGQDEITKTKNAYWINGKAHTRVTKSLEDLKESKYEYPDADKVIAHYQATIGQGGTVTEFMNLIKADNSLRGFTDISYDYLMPRIEILAARTKAKKISTEQIQNHNRIIENAHEELAKVQSSDLFTSEDKEEYAKEYEELILKHQKLIPLSEKNLEQALKDEINESTYMEARISGTGLDGLVRDFFTNLDKQFTWTPEGLGTFISKEAFNELFGPEGSMTALRQEVRNNNYYVNAEGLVLYDSKAGIAGEVDLLVVDRAGDVHIVDLKTGTTNTWKHFKNIEKGAKNSKVESYELQQLAYRNLLYNMTGITASINLLPIVRTAEPNTGKILTASLVKEIIPIDSKYWFELNPSADTIEKIDNHIPKKDAITEEVPEEVKEIIEEPTGQDSDQVAEPDVEVIGLSEQSTLDQMVDQNVYFEGKAYRLKKVDRKKKSPRFELYSPTKTLYLTDVTGETTIEEAGLNLPAERDGVISKYKVEVKSEKEVIVNDVKYDIVTDKDGNIVSLIPVNKPKQRIKNEAMLVAVEVQRNKNDYQKISEVNTEEEPVTHTDLEGDMNAEDYITTSLVHNIYNKNMSPTVADALDKLFIAEIILPLTEAERLALDLWVTDAIIDMTKLYNRKPTAQVGKYLDNLETINILLYTGNYEDYQREERGDEFSDARSTKGATKVNPRKKKKAPEGKQKSITKEGIESPTDVMTFEEVKIQIAKSTDIQTIRGELMIAYNQGRIDNLTLTKISGLLLEREQELDQGVNIELTFENMSEGMELIVKNDIFTGKKIFAEKYQTVTVTKVANGKISVKPLGSTQSRTYQDIELINTHFTTMELEKAKGKVSEEPLTVEDKGLIKETADTVQTFIATEMNNKSNEANAQTLDDIEDELFNNLDCKS